MRESGIDSAKGSSQDAEANSSDASNDLSTSQNNADDSLEPKEPEEREFSESIPSISALDMDIVKLTAQFVAKNGRDFLSELVRKEQHNFQFDFLRPQHSWFNYFTKLVEQYSKILMPSPELKEKLRRRRDDIKDVLADILTYVQWS
eukprot:Sdes_comp13844_c0_seq1m3311